MELSVSDDASPPASPVKKIAKPSSPSPFKTSSTPQTTDAAATPGPSSRLTQQESYLHLKEMFPDNDKQELEEAL